MESTYNQIGQLRSSVGMVPLFSFDHVPPSIVTYSTEYGFYYLKDAEQLNDGDRILIKQQGLSEKVQAVLDSEQPRNAPSIDHFLARMPDAEFYRHWTRSSDYGRHQRKIQQCDALISHLAVSRANEIFRSVNNYRSKKESEPAQSGSISSVFKLDKRTADQIGILMEGILAELSINLYPSTPPKELSQNHLDALTEGKHGATAYINLAGDYALVRLEKGPGSQIQDARTVDLHDIDDLPSHISDKYRTLDQLTQDYLFLTDQIVQQGRELVRKNYSRQLLPVVLPGVIDRWFRKHDFLSDYIGHLRDTAEMRFVIEQTKQKYQGAAYRTQSRKDVDNQIFHEIGLLQDDADARRKLVIALYSDLIGTGPDSYLSEVDEIVEKLDDKISKYGHNSKLLNLEDLTHALTFLEQNLPEELFINLTYAESIQKHSRIRSSSSEAKFHPVPLRFAVILRLHDAAKLRFKNNFGLESMPVGTEDIGASAKKEILGTYRANPIPPP